jgi:hypothetical protein
MNVGGATAAGGQVVGLDAGVAGATDSGLRDEPSVSAYDSGVASAEAGHDIAQPPVIDALVPATDIGSRDTRLGLDGGSDLRPDIAPDALVRQDDSIDTSSLTPDAGYVLDASPDRSGLQEVAGTILDGGQSDGLPQTCSTNGATECRNPLKLRTCTDGVWVESPCGNMQICVPGSPAACRPACPDLAAPSNAVVVCYMPFDPGAAYAVAIPTYNDAPVTTTATTSDPTGLPSADVNGAAFDTLDVVSPQNEPCASIVTDPLLGPVWHTPAPTRWAGRIYIWGSFVLQDFVKKYGGSPSSVALYVKTRKLPDSAVLPPVPIFYLQNGDQLFVTNAENDSAYLTPTSEWSIRHRDFVKDEIDLLSVGGQSNYWELDYTSGNVVLPVPTQPPENVEIAWFAVVMSPPS